LVAELDAIEVGAAKHLRRDIVLCIGFIPEGKLTAISVKMVPLNENK